MLRRLIAAALICVFAITTADARIADPRPERWCGWFLRQELGVADRKFNLARNWRDYGARANGPGIGVIVVWPRHVGRIVGGSPGAWVVRSGNDGGRVRERVRSLRGAIAFRWPR